MPDPQRYFTNNFAPQPSASSNRSALVGADRRLSASFRQRLSDFLLKLLEHFESHTQRHSSDGYSVYTGDAGIALLYLELSSKHLKDEQQCLRLAQQALAKTIKTRQLPTIAQTFRDHSFLLGSAGPLAIGVVLNAKLQQKELSSQFLQSFNSLAPLIANVDSRMPDELLYGRAGYLFAALWLRQRLGSKSVVAQGNVDAIVDAIVQRGLDLSAAEQRRGRPPLMYKWYGEHYMGAAHGIAGIVYMLLKAAAHRRDMLQQYVRPTVDFLIASRLPSGNYPAVESATDDKLVHWCHGAPGMVHLFLESYRVFGVDAYLQEALQCGELVWRQGLLRKGYGLCHGVAGNAYAFLALFQATGDEVQLYRAARFAEWCFDYGKHGCRTPDAPWSLFEGMAGTIFFLADLYHDPQQAAFPGFVVR